MVLIRAFLTWLVIIAAETVHGILRGILLVPIVGSLPARQIGVLIGSLPIFGVSYLFIRWIAAQTKPQLLGVGVLWVVLTVLFEISLGHVVLGLPGEEESTSCCRAFTRQRCCQRRRVRLTGCSWLG
jgi:hypothetical protein